MTHADQLQQCLLDLNDAARKYNEIMSIRHSGDPDGHNESCAEPMGDLAESFGQNAAAELVREEMLSILWQAQVLISGPAQILQQLAANRQLANCINWLSELHVLACIPKMGEIATNDLAYLTGVPEDQLRRVVRLTATAGFLCESRSGHIKHTPLSAVFSANSIYHDSIQLLTAHAAPKTSTVSTFPPDSQNGVGLDHAGSTAGGFKNGKDLTTADESLPRLRSQSLIKSERQWQAYLDHAGNLRQNTVAIIETLMRVDWGNLGSSRVVDIGSHSPDFAQSLVDNFPQLEIVLQSSSCRPAVEMSLRNLDRRASSSLLSSDDVMHDMRGGHAMFDSRISSHPRSLGQSQDISDAAVYVFHAPCNAQACCSKNPQLGAVETCAGSPDHIGTPVPCRVPTLCKLISAELRAHLDILKNNNATTMILTSTCILPQPGTVGARLEAVSRSRDLSSHDQEHYRQDTSMFQAVELQDLEAWIADIRDGAGKLQAVGRLQSRNGLVVAIVIKYMRNGS